MRLSYEQVHADKARMEQFICERIPDDGIRIDLGCGARAELMPCWDDRFGWTLLLETDEPEWVDLREVYRHFRRREMTCWEWRTEIEGQRARWKLRSLEEEVAVLRSKEPGQADAAGSREYGPTLDGNRLPKEVSTAEAAEILGVGKDVVLKLKRAGLLEYRTAGPPDGSRIVYRFLLASVIEFRTSYRADVPIPQMPPPEPGRRRVRGRQQAFKHLRLE
jgi:hypothetical protein